MYNSLLTSKLHTPEIALNKEEYKRYSRQLLLKEVGINGQKRLKAAKVLCVGAGGLGSTILTYLAAAGVGYIGIIDADQLDLSNLQRQSLHNILQIGYNKAYSASYKLQKLNPYCELMVYPYRVTSENILKIIPYYDVIVDGTDNFESKYLLNDACIISHKPYIYGSILQFIGQVATFNYQGGPNYRDIYPHQPEPNLVPSCSQAGVLGILPALIASIQVTESLKIILGGGETLSGKMVCYDALKMRFNEVTIRNNSNKNHIEVLQKYVSNFEEQSINIEEIDIFQLYKLLIERGEDFFLVDVRSPQEYQLARINSAHNIPLSELEKHSTIEFLSKIVQEKCILLHCKVDRRSKQAAKFLKDKGIPTTRIQGGINAWINNIDSSLPEY